MKQIPKEVKANMFIMECKMLPMVRYGISTNKLHVYNVQDRLIGYYTPNIQVFSRVDSYASTFSASLIDRILEG